MVLNVYYNIYETKYTILGGEGVVCLLSPAPLAGILPVSFGVLWLLPLLPPVGVVESVDARDSPLDPLPYFLP